MTIGASLLPDETVDLVLQALGLPSRPSADHAGLAAVYRAWCERVPFDNLRKRLFLTTDGEGPLPGHTPEAFFADWLADGTGGTCWANAGALHALLRALGFDAHLALGTMLPPTRLPDPEVVPAALVPLLSRPRPPGPPKDPPPNHGAVAVAFAEERYLVDGSMLHMEPLRLDAHTKTGTDHPTARVSCEPLDGGGWLVEWRPLHLPTGAHCRIETIGLTRAEIEERHEATRGWSPFNFALSSRVVRGDDVVGLRFGEWGLLRNGSGFEGGAFASPDERRAFLVDEIGYPETLVDRLPECEPLPPPGG